MFVTYTTFTQVNITTGVGWQNGRCVGNTPPINGTNFPGLCLEVCIIFSCARVVMFSVFTSGLSCRSPTDRFRYRIPCWNQRRFNLEPQAHSCSRRRNGSRAQRSASSILKFAPFDDVILRQGKESTSLLAP